MKPPRNEVEAYAEIKRANAFPMLPDAADDRTDPGPSSWPVIILCLIAAVAIVVAALKGAV